MFVENKTKKIDYNTLSAICSTLEGTNTLIYVTSSNFNEIIQECIERGIGMDKDVTINRTFMLDGVAVYSYDE